MSRLITMICLIGVLLLSACTVAKKQTAIHGPNFTPAHSPVGQITNGRWKIFGNNVNHPWTLSSMNRRYLWLSGHQIMCYDMERKHFTTFSEFDGLPFTRSSVGRLVTTSGNRTLLLLYNPVTIYYYLPEKGWRQMSHPPKSGRLCDIGFTPWNDPLAMFYPARTSGQKNELHFSVYQDNQWRPLMKTNIMHASGFVAMNDAIVVESRYKQAENQFWRVPVSTYHVDQVVQDKIHNAEKLAEYNNFSHYSSGLMPYIRWHGNTYLTELTQLKLGSGENQPQVFHLDAMRQITSQGIIEKPVPSAFLDLRDGEFHTMQIGLTTSGQPRMLISNNEWHLIKMARHSDVRLWPMIIDKNGDIWTTQGRMIDQQWQPAPGSEHELTMTDTAWPHRSYYEDQTGIWRTPVSTDYQAFSAADPGQSLFWTMKEYNKSGHELIDTKKHPPEMLQRIPPESLKWLPQLRDRHGNSWSTSGGIFRISPDNQVKEYPMSKSRENSGMWLSPHSGRIWLMLQGQYYVHEPHLDQFIPQTSSQIFDDFLIKSPHVDLALIPPSYFVPDSKLRVKMQGEWVDPFPSDSTFSCAYHNDRLLISIHHKDQTWEVDLKNERSVLLTNQAAYVRFDDQGRRILSNGAGTLLYDGDPFKDPAYKRLQKILAMEKKLIKQYMEARESDQDSAKQFLMPRAKHISSGSMWIAQQDILHALSLDTHHVIPSDLRFSSKNMDLIAKQSLFRLTFPLVPLMESDSNSVSLAN